jgi:hypothetical protein
MKEKGKETPIQTRHDCDICGEPAVVRDNDSHYYCFPHHERYCSCIRFEKIKEEYDRAEAK